jgi:predicted nucleotidyltransferase component of viral defense system
MPEKKMPVIRPVHYLNNLTLVDEDCIASLKIEVLLRRMEFRDYYDLYCILEHKTPDETKQIIENALRYSEHHLKSKNLIGMLTNSDRFQHSSTFNQLAPKYLISAKEIEAFMIDKLKSIF